MWHWIAHLYREPNLFKACRKCQAPTQVTILERFQGYCQYCFEQTNTDDSVGQDSKAPLPSHDR